MKRSITVVCIFVLVLYVLLPVNAAGKGLDVLTFYNEYQDNFEFITHTGIGWRKIGIFAD